MRNSLQKWIDISESALRRLMVLRVANSSLSRTWITKFEDNWYGVIRHAYFAYWNPEVDRKDHLIWWHECKNGDRWNLRVVDHRGSTWRPGIRYEHDSPNVRNKHTINNLVFVHFTEKLEKEATLAWSSKQAFKFEKIQTVWKDGRGVILVMQLQ